MVVVSLIEGAWSSYRGGQFSAGRNCHVTEVVTLMERMIMLRRWIV